MLRRISVQNFKSIQQAEVNLPKFSAIIGKNGSGKTNFISTITLLKELVSNRDLTLVVNAFTPMFGEFFYGETNPFSTQTATFSYSIETDNKRQFCFSFDISFSINKPTSFYISAETLKEIGGNTERKIYLRDGDEVLIDGIESSSKVLPQRLALASLPNEDSQEVANTIRSYMILHEQPKQQSDFALVAENQIDLSTIEGLAVSLHTKSPDLFESAMVCLKKIIPNFEKADVSPIDQSRRISAESGTKEDRKLYMVTWSYKGHDGQTSSILSSGDKRVIYMILSLFNSKNRSFFVAEEIENGMHFERLARLVDQLRTHANLKEIQVLFTTHSSVILDYLTVDEVIYCKKNPGEGSVVQVIKDTKEFGLVKDDWQGNSAADVVNSGLFD